MSKWNKVDKKPSTGSVIIVAEKHWKDCGWLSVSLEIGVVEINNSGDWYLSNNDDTGYGCLAWVPNGDFSHWAYVSDVLEDKGLFDG